MCSRAHEERKKYIESLRIIQHVYKERDRTAFIPLIYTCNCTMRFPMDVIYSRDWRGGGGGNQSIILSNTAMIWQTEDRAHVSFHVEIAI